MKILFLSALYPPQTRGGGELSTHYIAQGLRQIGHEVQVVTTGARNGAYEVEGVPVRVLAANLTAKPLLERRHSRKMAKILAREINSGKKYDVVHAHDFRSALALAELNLPNALVTTRDYAQICGSPNNLLADGRECPGCTSIKNVLQNRNVVEAPFLRKPFRVWQYRYNIGYRLKAFRKFKQQVFISHAQLAEIKKIQDLSQTQTTVIYNPVPPAYLNNAIQLPVG
ncbi:MAG: glycosyltransferase, partial [Candidatus Andersenbacteria bacterium]|nr:glycosyltransferase [Candidatus Andersenbacteria bacterium]